MDNEALQLITKVWRHTGVAGNVWFPHIYKIGQPGQKFREGPATRARKPVVPEMRDTVDWYWTPGISNSSDSRLAEFYPDQRVVWVDCDESYDDRLLQSLKPSFMWETSPGHKQAIWLMKEPVAKGEFHRDGFMGMLTQALGGDSSGVDIGQLLRVPKSVHHKKEPFTGSILRNGGGVFTQGQLLTRVARGLGFSPQLASELGSDDPYGDRSKLLWKFARSAAELLIPQELTFKLIKATKWNKWKDNPDRLKEDIGRAYDQQPTEPAKKDPERQQALDQYESHEEAEEVEAWSMATVDSFGPVVRKPIAWVLPGIIPEGGCGLLVAAPKVGKTRVAIEIALGLATGRKPLGRNIRRKTPVGFLSLEDGEYLFADRLSKGMRDARALHHWDGHIRLDGKELTWIPPEPMELHTNFAAVDLSDPLEQERMYKTIVALDLKLVIIDTLSMAIGKANVSDQKDMYAILKPLKIIAQATGCAIMFIHHTRKRVFEKGETVQESILGATALHGWSDFIMSLASPSEEVDFLRMGVQTKMGNDLHFIDSRLKIIKKPIVEEVVA